MTAALHEPLRLRLKTLLRNRFSKIREINQRYARPRIKTSGGVAFALLALRGYLIILIIILFFKFFTLLHA